VIGLPGGVFNGGKDVVALQEGVVFEDFFERSAGAEELEHVGNANALAPDAGASAALAFLDGDALEQFRLHAGVRLAQMRIGGKGRGVLLFGSGSLIAVCLSSKVKEGGAAQFPTGGDAKQVRAAATDGVVVGGAQFLRFAQHVGPVHGRVNQQRLFLQINIEGNALGRSHPSPRPS
jgi:hypothetical protein